MNLWQDRPVLITGVTGFVGSSLAERLVELGAQVVGLVRDRQPRTKFALLKLHKQVTLVRGCLEDLPLLTRTINEYEIEVVYHVAGQAIVGTAHRLPLPTFETNIEGTWNLLEACRRNRSVQALVMTSSDKVYGTQKEIPFQEELPLQPRYPYDVSMACADLVARSYFSTFGLPVVVVRFANLYGPGDLNFSRIIPETIRRALRGQCPLIRSDGAPERDYLYIEDAVDLYLLVAERIQETKGEIFNAGSGRPISVLELVKAILQLAGRPDLKPEILGSGSPAGEIDRAWLDAAKAQRILNWSPRVSLEEGLKETISWYASCRKTKSL